MKSEASEKQTNQICPLLDVLIVPSLNWEKANSQCFQIMLAQKTNGLDAQRNDLRVQFCFKAIYFLGKRTSIRKVG